MLETTSLISKTRSFTIFHKESHVVVIETNLKVEIIALSKGDRRCFFLETTSLISKTITKPFPGRKWESAIIIFNWGVRTLPPPYLEVTRFLCYVNIQEKTVCYLII